MKISFTGLNNIYIGRKNYPDGIRVYDDVTKSSRHFGDLYVVRMRGQLTDDTFGKDLTEYIDTVVDYLDDTDIDYINYETPDVVQLEVGYSTGKGTKKQAPLAFFNLNGKPVRLEKNKDLAIFTFMAKFTRLIGKDPNLSDDAKDIVKFINEVINGSAVNFIDR
ncbi:hypothetical protein IJ579_04090 [bacterium]|nr:hypothetical protein [bacterium]